MPDLRHGVQRPDETPAHRVALGLHLRRQWIDTMCAHHIVPENSTGHIDPHDAAFLWDLIEATRPGTVIELGTAAGVSAAILAAALEELVEITNTRPLGTPTVISYDLHPWCFFDRTKPVGFAIADTVPHLADRISVRPGCTAADAAAQQRGIRLVFIDADHRHPAPALDVLALLPALAPGAWIALHDIRLPELAERYRRRTGALPEWSDQSGPQRLYAEWPYEKIEPQNPGTHDDRLANTGAIRVPVGIERAVLQEILRGIARDGPREVKPHPTVAHLLAPDEETHNPIHR